MKKLISIFMLAFILGTPLLLPAAVRADIPIPGSDTKRLGGPANRDIAGSCEGNGVTIGAPIEKNNDTCAGGGGRNPIYDYAKMLIRFAAGIVGLLVLYGLVRGGYDYVISQGNASNVEAAKNRIEQSLIGLLLFILMFGVLNFIIPGGILQ